MAGDGVTKAGKGHSPARTVGRRCRSPGVTPTVTSSSSAAADGLLITKVASLGPPLLGAALLTALYTRMAMTTLSSSRFGAFVTLRRAQSPCALCRGDRAPLARKKPSRGWRPRQAFGVVPSRGEVPHQRENPWRDFARHGEPLQAWRAWSLAKFSWSCVGLGRPARGTLVSTVPTPHFWVSPVAALITLIEAYVPLNMDSSNSIASLAFQKMKIER